MLSKDEVLKQSENAFSQWREIWEANAKRNGDLYKKLGTGHKDLLFKGLGKNLLCIAFAPSFEKNIQVIKDNINENTDIACVDKCMGDLLKNGIKPKYVFLADAGIDYDKWLEPYVDQTEDITLLANVTSNPDWTYNWKGNVVFYVNKDNIETEKIYSKLSGCMEMIPASSNVGNTVVVFSAQILGYDEYYLLGYDYCWGSDDNYYAFNDSDKRYWMKHADVIDMAGRMVNTSSNLLFSSRWLSDFNKSIAQQYNNIKIYNCSDCGILEMQRANLKKKLQDSTKRKLNDFDRKVVFEKLKETVVLTPQDGAQALQKALDTLNVAQVSITHMPTEVMGWFN